jgi:hypothetical protein
MVLSKAGMNGLSKQSFKNKKSLMERLSNLKEA